MRIILNNSEKPMTPKTKSILFAAVIGLPLTAFAHDHERPDHFEGQASETLAEALDNFVASNAQVADILAQDDISQADLVRIHELTYTLENALERIDDEYDALEDQLEELHLASEGADIAKARELAETYLHNAERFPGSESR